GRRFRDPEHRGGAPRRIVPPLSGRTGPVPAALAGAAPVADPLHRADAGSPRRHARVDRGGGRAGRDALDAVRAPTRLRRRDRRHGRCHRGASDRPFAATRWRQLPPRELTPTPLLTGSVADGPDGFAAILDRWPLARRAVAQLAELRSP